MWLDLQVQRRLQAAGQDFVLDVSLQCTQRQVVLFGPSGAGKSLTLKAVAGLLRPGQGHVRLQGQTLFDAATGCGSAAAAPPAGLRVPGLRVVPALSVRQNVAFGLQKGWLNPRAASASMRWSSGCTPSASTRWAICCHRRFPAASASVPRWRARW
jgi:molybdate transport system ATP-binding protein